MRYSSYSKTKRNILKSGILGGAAAIALWAASGTSLHAAVITVYSGWNGTGYILESNNTGVFQNSGSAEVRVGSYPTDDRYNALLRFNLAPVVIPDGYEITGVSLTLTALGAEGSTSENRNVTVDLYESLRVFDHTATWSEYSAGNPWQTAGGTGANDRGDLLSSLIFNPRPQALDAKLTWTSSDAFVSTVSDLVDADGTLRLWLGINESDLNGARHMLNFGGNTYTTGSRQPVLNITYEAIPEPSCIALLGLGAFVLFVRRRRK